MPSPAHVAQRVPHQRKVLGNMADKLSEKDRERFIDICTRAAAYEANYCNQHVKVGDEWTNPSILQCAVHPANRSMYYRRQRTSLDAVSQRVLVVDDTGGPEDAD